MIRVNIFFGLRLVITLTILTIQVPLQSRAHSKNNRDLPANQQLWPTVNIDYPDFMKQKSLNAPIREVHFTNDFGEVVELDLICQCPSLGKREKECLAHFREIPITIRAEKEYHVKDGDKINVETKDNWELSIQKISNSALLSLKTFRDLVLDHFMPKKRIANFMDEWVWTPYNQLKLLAYRRTIAHCATTTITIHTEIEQHHESIRCSDIILDLDKLASEKNLAIEIKHENLLSMNVIIKTIK